MKRCDPEDAKHTHTASPNLGQPDARQPRAARERDGALKAVAVAAAPAALHYIYYIPIHYTTLHCNTVHYFILHYIILHYILHYITLHYITLHYMKARQWRSPPPELRARRAPSITTNDGSRRRGWHLKRGCRRDIQARDSRRDVTLNESRRRVVERFCQAWCVPPARRAEHEVALPLARPQPPTDDERARSEPVRRAAAGAA